MNEADLPAPQRGHLSSLLSFFRIVLFPYKEFALSLRERIGRILVSQVIDRIIVIILEYIQKPCDLDHLSRLLNLTK